MYDHVYECVHICMVMYNDHVHGMFTDSIYVYGHIHMHDCIYILYECAHIYRIMYMNVLVYIDIHVYECARIYRISIYIPCI